MMNVVQNRVAGLLVLLGLFLVTPIWAQDTGNASGTAVRSRRLIPEETFVIGREAVIRSAGASGAWIVTFENKVGEGELPAMVLMPSRRLQRLETAMELKVDGADGEAGSELRALVSGQVFAYRNYNFLMLTAMPRLQTPIEAEADTTTAEEVPEDSTAGEEEDGGDDNAGVGNASADVESMIKDLEADGPVAPIFQRPTADTSALRNRNGNRAGSTNNGGAVNSKGGNQNALVEGAFVMSRAARLIHTVETGAWAVVFEADDEGLADEPLIVQPCKMLEQMEARAQQLGDAFKLNISGQVYTYRGSVYLLPTLMQIPYQRDNLSP